ncbi:hypothetical protein C7K25_11995 [Gulosibacter molinativorax]|uniref:Uncharacterized protein n=1 Tax=Gulosibacter molinativorax TaxID=256821 RepID=A0ABT7CA57_9MICO|nr:hypothetical protein [Gulosibacter molinativorax]QUY63869.1 Hypotetical protein [Gulosibacter molinativorax]
MLVHIEGEHNVSGKNTEPAWGPLTSHVAPKRKISQSLKWLPSTRSVGPNQANIQQREEPVEHGGYVRGATYYSGGAK